MAYMHNISITRFASTYTSVYKEVPAVNDFHPYCQCHQTQIVRGFNGRFNNGNASQACGTCGLDKQQEHACLQQQKRCQEQGCQLVRDKHCPHCFKWLCLTHYLPHRAEVVEICRKTFEEAKNNQLKIVSELNDLNTLQRSVNEDIRKLAKLSQDIEKNISDFTELNRKAQTNEAQAQLRNLGTALQAQTGMKELWQRRSDVNNCSLMPGQQQSIVDMKSNAEKFRKDYKDLLYKAKKAQDKTRQHREVAQPKITEKPSQRNWKAMANENLYDNSNRSKEMQMHGEAVKTNIREDINLRDRRAMENTRNCNNNLPDYQVAQPNPPEDSTPQRGSVMKNVRLFEKMQMPT